MPLHRCADEIRFVLRHLLLAAPCPPPHPPDSWNARMARLFFLISESGIEKFDHLIESVCGCVVT